MDAWPPSPARPAVKPYLCAWKSYVAVLRGWACVSGVQCAWPAPRVGRTSPVAAWLAIDVESTLTRHEEDVVRRGRCRRRRLPSLQAEASADPGREATSHVAPSSRQHLRSDRGGTRRAPWWHPQEEKTSFDDDGPPSAGVRLARPRRLPCIRQTVADQELWSAHGGHALEEVVHGWSMSGGCAGGGGGG